MGTQQRGIRPPAACRDLEDDTLPTSTVYQHRIRVGWGDLDPAQIAYTSNIPGWALEALEGWYRACLGIDWFTLNIDYGIGTPFVSLKFDFHSPITSIEELQLSVYVAKLGNSSLRHTVKGYQDDTLCFTSESAAAFVNASKMSPIPIPANMRARIERYLAIQEMTIASK